MKNQTKNLNKNIAVWGLPEDAIARFGQGDINDIMFSPDGQYIAVATSIGLWLYTLLQFLPVALWDAEIGYTRAASFSTDSRKIAIYSFNERALKVWDIQSGVCVALMENSYLPDFHDRPLFSKNGKYLFVKTFQWCAQTGKLLNNAELQHPSSTYEAEWFTPSPDGNLLVGARFNPNDEGKGDEHEEIVVWHRMTGKQIVCLAEDFKTVWHTCFSPCSRYFTASNLQGAIRVWNVENGKLEKTYINYSDGDTRIYPHYTSEGNMVAAVVFPRKVEVWDVEKHEKLDTFVYDKMCGTLKTEVCFSCDGTQLAVAIPNELKIWKKIKKAKPGFHTLTTHCGHTDTVDSIAFSVNGKTLAAGYWESNVILWNVASKSAQHPSGEKLAGEMHAVYAFTNGEFISTSIGNNKDSFWISGIRNSKPLAAFTAPDIGRRRFQAYSPSTQRLARAAGKHDIHVWEYIQSSKTNETKMEWKKQTSFKRKGTSGPLAFSPDGTLLVSISHSEDQYFRNFQLWEVDTGNQMVGSTIPLKKKSSLYLDIAFSPCGDLIAGGQRGEIILWDAKTGKARMTFPQPADSQRSFVVCFSLCGQYIASGAWWQRGLHKVPVRLWKVESGKNIATFYGHTTDVHDLEFSPDGTILASAGHDGVIFLWDLTSYVMSK